MEGGGINRKLYSTSLISLRKNNVEGRQEVLGTGFLKSDGRRSATEKVRS